MILPSRRRGFSDHEAFTRARHLGPVAIEVGNQPLHLLAADGARERGRIIELIRRLVHRGIGEAPEPPRLARAETPDRIRQMDIAIPLVNAWRLDASATTARTTKTAAGMGPPPGLCF